MLQVWRGEWGREEGGRAVQTRIKDIERKRKIKKRIDIHVFIFLGNILTCQRVPLGTPCESDDDCAFFTQVFSFLLFSCFHDFLEICWKWLCFRKPVFRFLSPLLPLPCPPLSLSFLHSPNFYLGMSVHTARQFLPHGLLGSRCEHVQRRGSRLSELHCWGTMWFIWYSFFP